MFSIRMDLVLRAIIAGGEVAALPVRASWPVHRAVVWLASESARRGVEPPLPVITKPDPDVYVAVDGVETALAALVAEGFLVQAGAGYTARWVMDPCAAISARRELMRTDPQVAGLLVQAGQRMATWASTVLKNADTAAATWSSTVCGGTPTVRQPALVALR
jgi:hypothetical protein